MTAAQWWSIGVQVAGVVASLILAVLAIWGDYFRSRFAGPKLYISLFNGERFSVVRKTNLQTEAVSIGERDWP